MYDALIDDASTFSDSSRQQAIQTLEKVMHASRAYLTSYYQGEPNNSSYRLFSETIGEELAHWSVHNYRTKDRNLNILESTNPSHVLAFLKKFVHAVVNARIAAPDYIIGSACGASEVAFTLAGTLGLDVDFMRMSKRRNDPHVRVIPEHEERISKRARGRNVAVVEDYTCTARSLESVMRKVEQWKPATLRGYSVHQSKIDIIKPTITQVICEPSFHSFKLQIR